MEPHYVVVIVAIVFGTVYAAFEQWHKTRRAQLEAAQGADTGRVEALEERVRVLERIVTERGFELEEEFRRLERRA